MATKSATAPKSKIETKPKRAVKTLAGDPQESAERKNLLSLYENALKLMQQGKYEKAHEAFNELLTDAPQDLGDRIRMYIAACVSQIH
ncbi:MAG: hypothetical protein PW735_00635, partial [Acidobacteriaceae bacterium]|nr:hypothetical protein [Acidobacteriaceae bacterium]